MSAHLIIGASGQVGEHLLRATLDAGLESVGTYHSHAVRDMQRLDIRSRTEVQSLIAKVRPSVVYLPAALSNVDYCELHPEEGYETNVVLFCLSRSGRAFWKIWEGL